MKKFKFLLSLLSEFKLFYFVEKFTNIIFIAVHQKILFRNYCTLYNFTYQ